MFKIRGYGKLRDGTVVSWGSDREYDQSETAHAHVSAMHANALRYKTAQYAIGEDGGTIVDGYAVDGYWTRDDRDSVGALVFSSHVRDEVDETISVEGLSGRVFWWRVVEVPQ